MILGRMIILSCLLAGGSTAHALQPSLRIERSDDTAWNSFSDSEKMLQVGRQIQYYRDHGIPIDHSIRHYANQVEFYRQDPRNLQEPTRDLILKSVVRSADIEGRGALIRFMRDVHRVHEEFAASVTQPFSEYIQSGVFRDFDSRGHVREEWTYKNGRKDGLFQVYYPNGNLYQRFTYREGRLVQAGLVYYADGSLKEIEFYDNGVLNGPRKQYYESGALKGVVHFERGRPVGVVQTYNQDGTLQHEVFIEDGAVAKIRLYQNGSHEFLDIKK